MMKRKVLFYLMCFIMSSILCACSSTGGSDSLPETAAPAATPEPTAAPAGVQVEAKAPAATPEPSVSPSATPEPTSEPTPAAAASSPSPTAGPVKTPEPSGTSAAKAEPEPTPEPSEAPKETAAAAAPAGRTYTNVYFDYSSEIAALDAKTERYTSPEAADIGIAVADEKGASGVALTAASDGSRTEYYLNALVAGNRLIFSGSDIASASVRSGDGVTDLTVADGSFTFTPRPISADKPVDEVITITKSDNSIYNIHTVNEYMPVIHVTIGTEKPKDGVYTFAIDNFLLRVDTDGNIVYYRNFNCLEGRRVENFKPQDTNDGRFYTFCVELNPKMRGIGFVSGMFVLMDKNYKEINYITLAANGDKNHTHGEGYLDDHEFLLLGKEHWVSLSYTPLLVNNLEGGGIDGGTSAYVQACIIQEVENGRVLHEFNSADYPELYAAAMENTKYGSSSGQKTPNDFMDYAHANSIFIDPKDGNLLVSFRSQYSLIKFDRETGDIVWILGGALNQFSGLDSFKDSSGNLFIGQHYARYLSADLAGNDSTITVFDNHTNYSSNTTRVLIITLDEASRSASATAIKGGDLDKLSSLKHWSTHCASFEMTDKDSCVFGWGSNIMLNMNVNTIPTHALLTDYDMSGNVITFELSVERNGRYASSREPCFSYRVYKNAD